MDFYKDTLFLPNYADMNSGPFNANNDRATEAPLFTNLRIISTNSRMLKRSGTVYVSPSTSLLLLFTFVCHCVWSV